MIRWVALASLLPVMVAAQMPELPADARLRITTTDVRFTANFVTSGRDGMVVKRQGKQYRVMRTELATLERSVGRSTPGGVSKGSVIGLRTGFALGVIDGLVTQLNKPEPSTAYAPAETTNFGAVLSSGLKGAVAGVVAGIIIGAIVKTEVWQLVPLPNP